MKAPFKLPARFDGATLVAADCELIGHTDGASDEEKAFILWAVNNARMMRHAIKEAQRRLGLEMDFGNGGIGINIAYVILTAARADSRVEK